MLFPFGPKAAAAAADFPSSAHSNQRIKNISASTSFSSPGGHSHWPELGHVLSSEPITGGKMLLKSIRRAEGNIRSAKNEAEMGMEVNFPNGKQGMIERGKKIG